MPLIFFSSRLDIRLEISVVSTFVNLNKMSVDVKTEIKKQSVNRFDLPELSRTM